jgi:hypothetical protein
MQKRLRTIWNYLEQLYGGPTNETNVVHSHNALMHKSDGRLHYIMDCITFNPPAVSRPGDDNSVSSGMRVGYEV